MISLDSCILIYAVEGAPWTNDSRLAAASQGLTVDVFGAG